MTYIFGVVGTSGWHGAVVLAFIIIQLQGLTYSIYMHRVQAHQMAVLHPVIVQLTSLILWLTTWQMISPGWMKRSVTRHRKHHQYADTKDDPHSPYFYSIKQLTDYGGPSTFTSPADIKKYADDVTDPTNWVDINICRRWPYLGNRISLSIIFVLFGIAGIIPAIFILYHAFIGTVLSVYATHRGIGYVNEGYDPRCRALNMWPLAIFQGGEELHANHHARPSSPKLSMKWWEVDLGWGVLKLLEFFKLAKITKE